MKLIQPFVRHGITVSTVQATKRDWELVENALNFYIEEFGEDADVREYRALLTEVEYVLKHMGEQGGKV